MKVLLIEPDFPIPHKSKNHSSFLPIGLLKIASYHRSQGDQIRLLRGNSREFVRYKPDKILITSLFTYWANNVKESVEYYRKLYPKAKIEIGGIYASLLPDDCKKRTKCNKVHVGLYKNGKAEDFEPAYDLIDVDYQIMHTSRGCFRHCSFCGVWKIEKTVTYKTTIEDEITKNKVVFYDNNLLTNPHIENILEEIAKKKINNKVVMCESQSGLDGRILQQKPHFAELLRKAHFKNPRIAWDSGVNQHEKVRQQIDILIKAGYNNKDVYIFMLFNHKSVDYKDMRKKLEFCRRWGVQVIDCRFRPLNRTEDGYNPRTKSQENNEYYISSNWTDKQVRGFRRAVRRQNIAIRLSLPDYRYIEGVERGYVKI